MQLATQLRKAPSRDTVGGVRSEQLYVQYGTTPRTLTLELTRTTYVRAPRTHPSPFSSHSSQSPSP